MCDGSPGATLNRDGSRAPELARHDRHRHGALRGRQQPGANPSLHHLGHRRSCDPGGGGCGCTGDDILVTNGLYTTGGRVKGGLPARVVLDKSVKLRSVNGPIVTVIDGAGAGRCVYLGSGAILSGVTLTGGKAAGDFAYGGGVYASFESGVVSVVMNCILKNNEADYGGGAYSATLYNCILSGNTGYLYARTLRLRAPLRFTPTPTPLKGPCFIACWLARVLVFQALDYLFSKLPVTKPCDCLCTKMETGPSAKRASELRTAGRIRVGKSPDLFLPPGPP